MPDQASIQDIVDATEERDRRAVLGRQAMYGQTPEQIAAARRQLLVPQQQQQQTAPRMTGDVGVQRPGGPVVPVPSGDSFSLGPGAPTILPTTGSERVAPDPQWRQDWDRQQRQDSQNPFIQALGGPVYGSGGAFPTLRQAQTANPELTREMYAALIGQAAQHRIATTGQGLETTRLMDPRGGQLAVNQAQIEGQALPRQREAQSAAAYTEFIRHRLANGSTIQQANREWEEAGMQRPAFTNPQQAAGVPTPGAVVPQARGGNPGVQSRLESIYENLQRNQSGLGPNQPGARITDPQSAITNIVNHFAGTGDLQENMPAIHRFIIDRLGEDEYHKWSVARHGIFSNTSHQRADAAWRAAANARGANIGVSEANEESTGLPAFMHGLGRATARILGLGPYAQQ